MKNFFQKQIIKIIENFSDNIYESINKKLIETKTKEYRGVIRETQSHGSKIFIEGDILITEPKNVIIGNNVFLRNYSHFLSEGVLLIGDNVEIGRNVTIITAPKISSNDKFDKRIFSRFPSVVIEKNSKISMGVIIHPNVTIGEGSFIGPGITVSNDIPAHSVVNINNKEQSKLSVEKIKDILIWKLHMTLNQIKISTGFL